MGNKREISVAINLTAKIEEAQRGIASLQNKLNKLNLPSSVNNEFQSLFSGLEKEMDKLSQKTANGKLKFIDNSAVEKSIEKIDSLYSLLIQKLESRGIAAAGLKEDARAINIVSASLKAYEKSLSSIEKEELKLNRELEKQKNEKKEILEMQKKQTLVSKEEAAAQAVRTKSAKDEVTVREKALRIAQEELDKKIANSGGKYSKDQIMTKGSPLRKTDAYKHYKEAAKAVANAKDAYEAESKKSAIYTTKEKQAAELAAIEEKIDKATQALKEFNEGQKATAENNAFEEIRKSLEGMGDLDLSKYGVDLKEIKNIDQLRTALSKVKDVAQKNAEVTGKETVAAAKAAGDAYEGLTHDVNSATSANREFYESTEQQEAMQNKIKQFLGVAGASQVMRRALRDAMQTITELDATMTEMAVVTDLTVGDYWDQLPEYSKRASELGVSINSAYEAATLYYQQGLKTNEVNAISAETLKMARIAGLDAAEATDKMTAALRGFNMELNELSAQRVSDVYSELAAITAADVNEISTAMTKTASIASSAGMEFETTAAFLSQIIETTRESAETAGTAMKTVIARFQELKKAPDEIGEIDGEIIDANAIESALRTVGVSLRDSSGQFRELDEVFLELSSKWDGLDKNTQRYIATIAAGSRQQSRFIAMMSDYERTQELVTAANTSAGASNKQFEKTMDSLASKLERLKNAWHEFSMGILDSDLVKTGVDILTKFLEIINKATSSLDGVGNSLTKIVTIFTIFKLGQKIFDKFSAPIVKLFTNIVSEATAAGYKAAQGFHESVERYNNEKEQTDSPNDNDQVQKVGFAGFSAFGRAREAQKEIKAARKTLKNSQITQADQEELEELKKQYTFKESGQVYRKGSLSKGQSRTLTTEDANKVKDRYKELETSAKKYADAENIIAKKSKEKWDSITKGMGAAAEATIALGIGLSTVGTVLSELGLEEAGEAISTIGQGFTILGTGISALIPILKLAQAWAAQTALTVGAALGWILAIVAAVAVLGVVVYNHIKKMQENSPEGKLKAATEEAEQAAEVADRLTESYRNLNDSIEDLGDKYNALEDLTRGTKKWNEAVQEINNSVLDLIEQYPELAKFMTSKGGVLTIDFELDGVKDILSKKQKDSMVAKSMAALAAVEQKKAEKVLLTDEFKKQAASDAKNKVVDEVNANIYRPTWDGDFWGDLKEATKYAWTSAETYVSGQLQGNQAKRETKKALDEYTTEDQQKLAKAVANGIVQLRDGKYQIVGGREEEAKNIQLEQEWLNELPDIFSQISDQLRDTGKQILEFEKEALAHYKSIAAEVIQGLNPEEVDEATADYFSAVLSDKFIESYTAILKQEYNPQENPEHGQIVLDAAKATYEKVESTRGGLYVNGGSQPLSKEEEKELYAAGVMSNLGEDFLQYLSYFRFYTEGETFSGTAWIADYLKNGVGAIDQNTISEYLGKADYSNFYEQLLTKNNSITKALFGTSSKVMREMLNEVLNEAKTMFDKASQILEKEGEYDKEHRNLTGVTAGQAIAIATVASKAGKDGWGVDEEGQNKNFVTEFNRIMNDLDPDQQESFAAAISAFKDDPTNREKWEGLEQVLEDYEVTVTDTMRTFIAKATEATGSIYSSSWLSTIGVSSKMESQYRQAIEDNQTEILARFHATFKKWGEYYKQATSESYKAQHELINKVAERLIDNLEKQIEEQEKLAESIDEANSKMLDKMQESIDAQRQSRENDETEQELEDKYAQLAYLQQDTSGANSQEILDLQKEIAEAEQDYQDTLIDQALQNLADDNAHAAEQRDRQIELLRLQLEAYQSGQIYKDAEDLIQDAVDEMSTGLSIEDTELGKLLLNQKFASDNERATLVMEISELIGLIMGGIEPAEENETKTMGGTGSNITQTETIETDEIIVTEDAPENPSTEDKPGSGGGGGGGPRGATMVAYKYASGGLADFTGPAWLDGTPSKPEYILNASQTERFFSLVDVLESFDPKEKDSSSGDNYFDIEINVEKIDNDYDVEQIANKIRGLIYEDATYRNVNAINLIR